MSVMKKTREREREREFWELKWFLVNHERKREKESKFYVLLFFFKPAIHLESDG
jgi:hypothetical protein